MFEEIHAFRIGGYQGVFDAVVDHLDEMTGTARAAVQIALLRRVVVAVATGGTRAVAGSGDQGLEDGSRFRKAFAAPPIIRQYPRSRPRTPPLVPQSRKCRSEVARPLGVSDSHFVVGVATVDDDIACLQTGQS